VKPKALRRVSAVSESRESPVRAGIVVTGTEVITGTIQDKNGPWISQELARRGVEVSHILIVGDRPADLEHALRFLGDLGRAAGAELGRFHVFG
jgi:nicotinamide-nucleotide amidase